MRGRKRIRKRKQLGRFPPTPNKTYVLGGMGGGGEEEGDLKGRKCD